jgi:Ca-activated chloride channel homolog
MDMTSQERKTMQPPKIEIIPARPAVCRDQPAVLDVLVRIIPPVPEVHFLRPPINLGIVLDRSGSMAAERKMEHAREAAIFAVSQLLPTDRVSITIYDEVVETIVPSEPVVDKPGLVTRIRGIMPRGSTNLFEGWVTGARQVTEHVNWEGLNRVLLLSDGLANAGVTDPNTIRSEVGAMATTRVSTSTLGVGREYNENLMEAMAEAGDGNYYYVESAVQLADIFQTELNGLMATTARDVGLRVETARADITVQILNELERDQRGRLKLPNLVLGMPISILVRLTVASSPPGLAPICRFQLDWDEPGSASPGRRSLPAILELPCVPARLWSEMPVHPAVAEHAALHMAANARKEAISALDQGDEARARTWLGELSKLIAGSPKTEEMTSEWANLGTTMNYLDAGQSGSARKAAHYQQHFRKHGKGTQPPK